MTADTPIQLSDLTALYSPLDIEYAQAMSGPYEDHSVHYEDCTIIAGLKDGKLTGFWRPMVAVGDRRTVLAEIKRLYFDVCNNMVFMDFLIGGELSEAGRFLLERGYQARPVYTQVLDLTFSTVYLHTKLRKSYKSLVAKYENVDYGSADDYRRCHNRYSGRERPEKTWDIQARMIERQDAYVLTDGPDAAVLIYNNGITAYYAGGRSSPDKNTHALLWQAIIRSEAKIFELGEQVFCVGQIMMDGRPATEKHVNIGHYKKGFGGQTMTRLILEKA